LASQKDKDSRIKATKLLDYVDALVQAGLNLREPYIKHLAWEEHKAEMLEKGYFTQREYDESTARVAIMLELVKARNEGEISQQKLEELSGVRQAVISRMETGQSSPSLETVIKVLAPLGKTLAVVPLEHGRQ
jgi:DNA-binding XRE family transcriptional regulator